MNEKSKLNWLFPQSKIANEDIKIISEFFKLNLPKEFIEVVINYNGAQPDKSEFDIKGHHGQEINSLISLSKKDKTNIIDLYELIRKYLPSQVIPFADDPFGNLICFDYRKSKVSPLIVFWDHEEREKEKLLKVSDTFEKFLLMLK